MKTKLIFLLMCTGLMTCSAQILTLDSCFSIAQQNNSDMRKAAIEVQISQAVKKQLFTKFFPSLDINLMGFAAASPIISFDVTQIAQTEEFKELLAALYEIAREYNPTVSNEISLIDKGLLLGGTIIQPIYAGGRIVNGNQLASLGIDASKLKQEITQRDVFQSIEENYWLISGLQEKRRTIRQVLKLLDTLTEVANTALESGLITRNDILKVELKKNEIATLSLKLENGIALASHMLCQMIGIPMREDLQLDSLPDIDGKAVPLEGDFKVSGRPEYVLLDLNVEAEKLRKKLTLGEALPSVGIGGTAGFSNIFDHNRANAIAFFSVKVPLLSWWETSHKLRAHNLNILQAENMRDDLRNKMKLQNEQVYDALNESAMLLRQHASAKQMAEDNYNISLMNYEAGIGTMSELLESQALLMQAMDQYTDAKITYRTSQRKFENLNQ